MPRIFFSYSHKDEVFRDQLEIHLSALERQKVIESWYDRKILAGSPIDDAIDQHLNGADVILLLISPDFIASDYCYEKEVHRALERHWKGSARVIPVILRPCDWHALPFGKLLATPTDGQAITLWPNRDAAFLDVVRSIKGAIRDLGSPTSALVSSLPIAGDRNPGPDGTAVEATLRTNEVNVGSPTPQGLGIAIPKQVATEIGKGIARSSAPRIGIDMGSNTTRICIEGRGIALSEPSFVATAIRTRKPIAVGSAALELVSMGDGNHMLFRPIQESVISEPDLAAHMLRNFLETLGVPSGSPAIFSVPEVATNANLKVLVDTAKRAKLGKIEFVERPLLAAFGGRRVPNAPQASTVVDIGAATTDVAIIAKSRIFYSRTVRAGGNQIDEAITRFMKRAYNLLIGGPTAERVKIEVGSAWALEKQLAVEVKGRNLIEGIPRTITVKDPEVREVIIECLQPIFTTIIEARDRTPHDISSNSENDFIALGGGSALIRGIDEAIRDRIGVWVQIQEDPIDSVARGLGALLSGHWKPARPMVYPIYR